LTNFHFVEGGNSGNNRIITDGLEDANATNDADLASVDIPSADIGISQSSDIGTATKREWPIVINQSIHALHQGGTTLHRAAFQPVECRKKLRANRKSFVGRQTRGFGGTFHVRTRFCHQIMYLSMTLPTMVPGLQILGPTGLTRWCYESGAIYIIEVESRDIC
jgi:hypothetical protein